MKLTLANNLKLPADEAATQKYGFIGRSGSGKSYAAMKLAELLLGAGTQVIALDWVGIWWSLRLAKSGKAPGFEHVYIFGGEHADVPLEPTSGALMADLIVDKHISVVLDVMHFRKAERTRFATAFAEQFFHRKKTARTACHLFIEEAQAYLPQMVRGDEARMVGVFEDIGKVGRNYGIGNSLISQRPQAINKDVLNQVEVLLAFQTNGPQERKAIAGWTAENTAAGTAMAAALPTLPVGDALVWSPQWLRIAQRVHIAERDTYNASSTPTSTATAVQPKTLAKSDLEALGTEIKATIEKAKADDPRELKRQLAEAQRMLLRQSNTIGQLQATPAVERRIDKPVLTDVDRTLLEKLTESLRLNRLKAYEVTQVAEDRLTTAVTKTVAEYLNTTRKVGAEMATQVEIIFGRSGVQKILAKLEGLDVPAPLEQFRNNPELVDRFNGTRPQVAKLSSKPAARIDLGDRKVSVPQQVLLNSLAWLESVAIEQPRRGQLALVAKVSASSSGFEKNVSTLRTLGLVDFPVQGAVTLTPGGRALAVRPATPPTATELHESLIGRVSTPQGHLLRALIAAYPSQLSREELAARVNVSDSSSGFEKNVSTLRSLGLAEFPVKGFVKAAGVLFLEIA